jgi:hypothetical protein
MRLTNNLEGGTSGTAISSANSGGISGNAFDTITGTAPNFSNSQPAHGALGMALQGTGAAQWTSAGGSFDNSITTMWGRCYVLITATPSVVVHGPSLTSPTGATATGFWEITTGAKITTQCKGGTTRTSTTVLSTNTLYRIEWKHVLVPSGTCTWDTTIYTGESASPTETMTQATGTGVSTDTNINAVKWGSTNAVTANTIFFDDFEVNDSHFPGPLFYDQPHMAVRDMAFMLQPVRARFPLTAVT